MERRCFIAGLPRQTSCYPSFSLRGTLICSEGLFRAVAAPERTWRHLDTMQFKAEILAAVPRTRCEKCGVKTVAVPWAGRHSRFTLLLEALAVKVLQAAISMKKAAELLNIGCDSKNLIIERAVLRGLKGRQLGDVRHFIFDNKSFGVGETRFPS